MARRKSQVGRRVEGWKSKSWYKVYAPETFEKAYIGEIISSDPENLVGRVMQTTLGEITQDYSKQNIKMRFKISSVAGDAAYSDFVGHEVTKDYIRAMVKRRTSRIDSIVLIKTKDGKSLRVTTTCFTISCAERSQVHAIRKTITDMMLAKGAEMTYDELVKEIVLGNASREVFKDIKTIFPTRRVEVIKSKSVEAKTSF